MVPELYPLKPLKFYLSYSLFCCKENSELVIICNRFISFLNEPVALFKNQNLFSYC